MFAFDIQVFFYSQTFIFKLVNRLSHPNSVFRIVQQIIDRIFLVGKLDKVGKIDAIGVAIKLNGCATINENVGYAGLGNLSLMNSQVINYQGCSNYAQYFAAIAQRYMD